MSGGFGPVQSGGGTLQSVLNSGSTLTTAESIGLADNTAAALTIESSDGTDLAVFSTTNAAEKTEFPAAVVPGKDAASNTTAVTNGSIRGGKHVAGGTADQSGTLTIESPDSKGSGESKIIFKVPVPAASGTAVNATTEVMNVSYVDALASKGVEITGVLDVSGVMRSSGNLVCANATIFARGANAGVNGLEFDQGGTGTNKIVFPDNQAQALRFGEGAFNGYLTFDSTDSAEFVEATKPLKLNVINGGITAFAGGGQASATQLVYGLNRVTVVASNGDSVKLPAAVAGGLVMVTNADAAQSINLYPASGDAINNLAADAALSVGAGKTVWCAAYDGTNWGVTTP